MMSLGYAAVFAMFFALYLHALTKADQLELNDRELQLTRFACWQQGVHVLVGAAVVAGRFCRAGGRRSQVSSFA